MLQGECGNTGENAEVPVLPTNTEDSVNLPQTISTNDEVEEASSEESPEEAEERRKHE